MSASLGVASSRWMTVHGHDGGNIGDNVPLRLNQEAVHHDSAIGFGWHLIT
jgi:hypothetical protein